MQYKVELRYAYGWDDAGWTDEAEDGPRPTRFPSVGAATEALEKFFSAVRAAVRDGNMDAEKDANDYRIVLATE
jgi:hypothetical protein